MTIPSSFYPYYDNTTLILPLLWQYHPHFTPIMTITLMKEWSHFHPSNPSRNQSTQLLVSHTAMTRVPHPMACAVKQRLQATVSRQISTENATVEQTKMGRKISSLFFSPLLFLFLFLYISLSLSLTLFLSLSLFLFLYISCFASLLPTRPC